MILFDGNKKIEVPDFNYRTHKYDYESGQIVELSTMEKQQWLQVDEAHKEQQHKNCRAGYLDAYRKYQAAVNYGEFERVPAIDSFIDNLRNKNWSVLNSIPPQIKYFAGEIGLAASGLIRRV